jgi:capsular exopolysaccharide synthesis family protein
VADAQWRETGGQSQGVSEEETSLDLRQYWLTVVNHLWLVALCTVLVTAATTVWTLRQPKIYRAQASVAIDLSVPKVLTDVRDVVDIAGGAASSPYYSRSYVDLQLAMLKSKDMSVEVARRLASDPSFVPISERENVLRWLPSYVSGTLQAYAEKDSRLVTLAAEDTVPERATRLVNTAADFFVEQNLSQRMEATSGASDWLVDQVQDLNGRLETSEVALHKFKEAHDILSATFEDKQSISSATMLAMSTALTSLRLKKLEAEVVRKQVKRALEEEAAGSGAGLMGLPLIQKDDAINASLETLQKVKTSRAEILSKYGPMHPKVLANDRQVAAEEEELKRRVNTLVYAQENEYQGFIDLERTYEHELEKARKEAFEVNRHQVEYNRLRREQTNNERLYEMVLKRQKEADLAGALKFNNMRVLDRSDVPSLPVRPNNTRNVMFGFFIGLLLGVALAFVLEFLDNTIKGQQDIEQKMRLTFLGVLPSIKVKSGMTASEARSVSNNQPERDLHVHLFPKSAVAECCRAIRTNLLFMGGDAPLRTMLVTSPSPSEGKTTAATSLAIAIAQSGSRVLLVDTDMRRPRIHKSFKLSNDVGLTSVLVGDVELKDACKATEVPGLQVLPCGPLPPNPSELLHTARFRETLARLLDQFDKVILDSPPVGAVADPLILSSYVGGVVLAVRSQKTTKDSANRARRALQDVNARILGVVLNDLDLDRGDRYYNYYPARYGYVYGEPEPNGKAEAA